MTDTTKPHAPTIRAIAQAARDTAALPAVDGQTAREALLALGAVLDREADERGRQASAIERASTVEGERVIVGKCGRCGKEIFIDEIRVVTADGMVHYADCDDDLEDRGRCRCACCCRVAPLCCGQSVI